MKFTEVQSFIKYLKTRSYNLDIRYGKEEVLLTVCFFREQIETLILRQQERECIAYIQQAILYQQPDSVEVEITSDVKSEFHQCIMNGNVFPDDYTDDNFDDRTDDNFRRMNETDDFVGSNGYSQQDIEEIVNKRLEDLRKEHEIIEIKSKLLESAETMTHQKQTIKSFKQTIEDKNKTIEERNKIIEEKNTIIKEKGIAIKSLNQKLRHKKTLEYYAQLAGKLIQNTGLKKEDVGKVLGGILPQNKSSEHKDKTDESGIIEE